MSKEIRTRQVHRNIKALDKTVTGVEWVKHAYVRTKDGAEHTQIQHYDTPEEYAGDKITHGTDNAARETVHQITKQSGRVIDHVKENGYQSKEQLSKTARQEAGRKEAQKQAGERALRQKAVEKKASQMRELPKQTIKTADRSEKTIKTAHQAGQTVKSSGKGIIKVSSRTVKTAERTARTTVKTTEQAAKATQQAAKASAKTAQKAAQATRQAAERTAKVAVRETKAAVQAVIASMKSSLAAIGVGGWIAVLILMIVVLFGGILCMVGGDNSGSVSPVSAEVEAYEPLIRQYANQYGIGEYVELIKAVMMQESGGRGLDPMQSSEGGFNTRYPRKPNGITDPEYSIQCGVQEVKSCLVSAGVENPIDMQNIRLALQGYNFGNGYISWAKNRYGGYSLANAAEFSDMMAQRMGWSNYGDKQYVPHVLRYYAFGRIPTGTGNGAIVAVALTQEGNSGDTYWSWYGFAGRVEWCACFVSWCADQCGYIDSGVMPRFSLCSDGVRWFEQHGRFRDGSYVPAAGDIIFFDWGNDGTIDHVGIVENVIDGVVHTVEGNSGDKVRRKSYLVGSSVIYGYGIPTY
ncbi:lysozyme family protein [Candidatus Merdisoma sp. JLR.KK011]|uniref:lysozyme family protein n=1 Tax=Candidatus Merdisoma sp. JLR.KK011 TaxID=3114299 RepID=UPI002FF177CB